MCRESVSVELCTATVLSHHIRLMNAIVLFHIYVCMCIYSYSYISCACSIEAGEVSSSWDENQWKEFLDNLLQS
jgi:hypothetical protein